MIVTISQFISGRMKRIDDIVISANTGGSQKSIRKRFKTLLLVIVFLSMLFITLSFILIVHLDTFHVNDNIEIMAPVTVITVIMSLANTSAAIIFILYDNWLTKNSRKDQSYKNQQDHESTRK